MTPKEKAKELVYKYLKQVESSDKYSNHDDGMQFYISQQCAIIAVNEIINEPAYADSGSTYWQQVKQEISNL